MSELETSKQSFLRRLGWLALGVLLGVIGSLILRAWHYEAAGLQPNIAPLPDYALFAPDDASFTAYLVATYGGSVTNEATAITFINGLSDVTTPTLAEFTSLIKYHIVIGRKVTTDFPLVFSET